MMIKYAALISVLAVVCQGQRPPYAGSANRYPPVLPRFQDELDNATATPAVQGSTVPVGNRLGEGTANSTGTNINVAPFAAAVVPVTTTVAPTTRDLPVLALGQADFVDRIKDWPVDQQPFWYINRQQVAQHLNPVNQQNVVQPGVGGRSFFAGRK